MINENRNLLGKRNGGGVSPFNFGGASALTGARGFRVQYNTSNFAYLTTSGYSDAAAFKSGSNVIDVQTVIAHDTAKAAAGIGYYQDVNNNDRIAIGNSGGGGTAEAMFFNRAFAAQFTTTQDEQSCCIDSINSHVISLRSAPNRISIKDFSNTLVEILNIGTTYTNGKLAYNQFTGDLYVATFNLTQSAVERWKKVAGAWALQETMWFGAASGIGIDFIFNRLIVLTGSGANNAFRTQSLDGRSRIFVYNVPLNTLIPEGVAVDPRDGTFWIADPSGNIAHGSIVDGNRGWHTDPEGKYKKFWNAPHMTPLSMFKHNGVITGQLSNEEIIGATSITYPVLNCTGFTNHQNASAYQDMDGVQLTGLIFRGSNTAPTTSSTTPVACDITVHDANGTNDGWGGTVPGEWQETPPALNCVQAKKVA